MTRAPATQHPAGRQLQTREALTADLRGLGVQAGQVLLVHSSMRRIGWLAEGPATVVTAICDILGSEGTLVVPTETTENSDSSRAHLARIAGMTTAQIERYRAAMQPFDRHSTPSTGMGRVAEQVRLAPGAIRSEHPQSSFAALGPMAGKLMADHRLDSHLGEYSPLGLMYDLGAWILLLGVGYEACTAFHLAEYKYLKDPPRRTYRCVMAGNDGPRWVEYQDVKLDDGDFGLLGADLDAAGLAVRGRVGEAECRLVQLVSAVDFAAGWLAGHRVP